MERNLAQLFKPVEKIVGIEITRGWLIAARAERDKTGTLKTYKIKTPLKAGVISGGAVKDQAALVAALKALMHAGRDVFSSANIILALPAETVFTDIMRFPPLAREQIAESLALNLKSSAAFPLSADELYYDWQMAHSLRPAEQEILIACAPRPYVRAYQEACEQAGLEPIVFEAPQASVARAVTNFAGKPGLIIRLLEEGVEFSFVVHGELRFARFVSLSDSLTARADLAALIKDELFRTRTFLQAEYPEQQPEAAVLISPLAQKKNIAADLSRELSIPVEQARLAEGAPADAAFAAAYGAALRGLIPREEDALVSVMPVGTEETYRSRQFLAYASLWSDIINATAVLMVVLFGTVSLWLASVRATVETEAAHKETAAATQEQIGEFERLVLRFNAAAQELAALDERIFPWSGLLTNIANSLAYEGISVERITLAAPGAGISVSVTAQTRDAAIAFRKSLEGSGLYARVEMPFLSVIQRTNIQTNIVLYPLP